MHVNWKWTFTFVSGGFAENFQSNRVFQSKEAKEYKFYIIKAFLRGKMPHFRLTSVVVA